MWFLFFIISITSLNAETVAVKCHIDEEHSYSFLFNFNDKKATWLDQNNQDMIITIFPDVEKGGKLLKNRLEKNEYSLDPLYEMRIGMKRLVVKDSQQSIVKNIFMGSDNIVSPKVHKNA